MELMNKAVFFDRDGIINFRPVGDYILKPEDFHIIPDFLDLLKIIKELGYLAIIISNQQGVGKGFMTENNLKDIDKYMYELCKLNSGYYPDDSFYCTDLKESNSYRRKPNPGMILEAAEKWDIDLKNSFFIGDSISDITAGRNAGVKTIFVSLIECPDADYNFPNLYNVKESIFS